MAKFNIREFARTHCLSSKTTLKLADGKKLSVQGTAETLTREGIRIFLESKEEVKYASKEIIDGVDDNENYVLKGETASIMFVNVAEENVKTDKKPAAKK